MRSENRVSASSIFGAVHFDRWVVTHSVAGSSFHGHRPILRSQRRPSECLDERRALRTPHAYLRFSPHRQYCLPVMAHLDQSDGFSANNNNNLSIIIPNQAVQEPSRSGRRRSMHIHRSAIGREAGPPVRTRNSRPWHYST